MTDTKNTPTGVRPSEALRRGLAALESHLDESCRDHDLKHRDLLCPCNKEEVPMMRSAIPEAERMEDDNKRLRARDEHTITRLIAAQEERDRYREALEDLVRSVAPMAAPVTEFQIPALDRAREALP